MTTATKTRTDESCCGQGARSVLPRWLAGRRLYWLLGGAALVAGAAFNWGWLVAAGIAPLLVAVLPCVAMCALGLCMKGRSSSQDAKPAQPEIPMPREPQVSNPPLAAEAITANAVAPVRQLADASAARSESVGTRS